MIFFQNLKVFKPSRSPWLYFLVFLLFSALLSWLPFTLWQRFWLFPLGLALMLALAWQYAFAAPGRGKPAYQEVILRLPSFWIWVLLLAAAAFMRFYRLVSLPLWPTWDDAANSALAILLAEQWDWSFFLGSEKIPPLFHWALALFFKATGPSLHSLWLFPAFLSLASIPMAWLAARQFFSPSFAFVATLLTAFQFTVLFDGRFCIYLTSTFTGELFLLWLFGRLLAAHTRSAAVYRAVWLGGASGISLYLSFIFLPVIVFFFSVLVWKYLFKPPRSVVSFLCFLFPLMILVLPIGGGLLENIFHGHISTYLVSSASNPFFPQQIITFLSYLTVYFFGSVDRSYWAFGPFWGGYLNPILAALFFLGLGELIKLRRSSFFVGWSVAILFCFLPTPLFNTVEFMRIRPALPFLMVPVAAGILTMLASLNSKMKMIFLILLLLPAFVWDGTHLFLAFGRWSATEALRPDLAIKSPERYRAFQILQDQNRKHGPGLVFSDFVSDVYDQSLLVSAYPFNAARNPNLNPDQASWAGILADLHYQEALRRRFPDSRFYLLSNPQVSDGPILVLAVIPLADSGRINLKSWLKVHHEIQGLFSLMPYHVKNPDFKPVLRKLLSFYPECEKDDLLKGWLLEKILDLFLVSEDITQAQWFLERPVADLRSFPFLDLKFAQLYHRLGMALLKAGEKDRARECFRRAGQFDQKYKPKEWIALIR